MLLLNAKVNDNLVNIHILNGKIDSVTPSGANTEACSGETRDLNGKIAIPGLIDIHTHGYAGIDVMDGKLEDLSLIYAKNGVTAWLPTTVTDELENINRICSYGSGNSKGAQILGYHIEGPFINSKYKGAQNEKYICNPDINKFNRIPNVKMVTLAPELPGSLDFIKAADCIVSLGHTACNYETADEAIKSGANCLTHTFNAMPPLLHREPSVIGAAIVNNIYVQLICDAIHVHKAAILALYKIFGADKVILISDSIISGGLPDGEYIFGGNKTIVRDGISRMTDGTISGSTSTLLQDVIKATEFGIPFSDAVKMATETPAKLLGVNKGKLQNGYDADILILNDDLSVDSVIIAGQMI